MYYIQWICSITNIFIVSARFPCIRSRTPLDMKKEHTYQENNVDVEE